MADEIDEADESPSEVPDGAAVFPEIPAELGVHPLLLAVVHALVFLEGSDPSVVNTAAASEAVGFLSKYLARLKGRDLQRVREDLRCLVTLARQEKWPKVEVHFLQSFLADYGVEPEDNE